jgi:hypothetical protein
MTKVYQRRHSRIAAAEHNEAGKRCGTRLTNVEADLHIPESSDNVVDSASCSVTGFSSQKSSIREIPFRLQASGTGIKNA